MRAWHDAHDAALKELNREKHGTNPEKAAQADARIAQIQASLKSLHDHFLSRLAAVLTPGQVEQVKDKMTYGKVKVTYDAYCEIVPGLTETEKARMLAWLKEAREEAMDCGSAEEKSAVFKRYKGKINNYLTAQGHDVKQAYKDWGRKQKEKAAAAKAAE